MTMRSLKEFGGQNLDFLKPDRQTERQTNIQAIWQT